MILLKKIKDLRIFYLKKFKKYIIIVKRTTKFKIVFLNK